MISLSPRYDLFRFKFPKDFLPEEVEKKYAEIIAKNPGVLTTPIDYLNESIQGITFPGINDTTMTQDQHGFNTIHRQQATGNKLGKINVEPKTDVNYTTAENPLDKIDREFKVTFRLNQGFYNYFMLYETIFYRLCKPLSYPPDKIFTINILKESGGVVSKILLYDIYINGIDPLEFNYTKLERSSGTFDISFRFNNIDFEILDFKESD